MKKTLLVLVAAVLAALPAAAAPAPVLSEPSFVVTGDIDWSAAVIAVEARRTLDASLPSPVRAKADAETFLDDHMSDFLARAIAPLRVDSSHTIGDLLAADPDLFARINDNATSVRPTELFLTPDLSVLVARYRVPMFGPRGVAAPLFPAVPTPMHRWLGDVTTRKFTGLLIFAKGMLAARGTDRMLAATPALFPRVWDEQMNLVLDKSLCTPEALARWGEVGYFEDIDDPALDLRVGPLPLRLAARGVFGQVGTDIIISTEGARQLLALTENIDLLRDGKVAIVYESLK